MANLSNNASLLDNSRLLNANRSMDIELLKLRDVCLESLIALSTCLLNLAETLVLNPEAGTLIRVARKKGQMTPKCAHVII